MAKGLEKAHWDILPKESSAQVTSGRHREKKRNGKERKKKLPVLDTA